jgi:hypothetical protein
MISPARHHSQPKKRTFAALTLRHRTVSYDWSKVALRVMVDAAVEAGHYLLTQTPLNSTPYLMS